MVSIAGQTLGDAERERLLRLRPAGVLLFRRNIDEPDQVKSLIADLRSVAAEYSDRPLLVAIDHEGGSVHRFGGLLTRFPPPLALGSARRSDLAEQVGLAMAGELLELGITVNFAPVVDLLLCRTNPQLLTRAFGDAPLEVGRLAAAFIRGAQSAGLAATAKHFPGLGDCDVDSHLDLPVIPHPLPRFRSVELVPFRMAIEQGVALIMVAHVAVPGITGREDPASLCGEVVDDLLRGELGFEGVVVTDALEMKGALRDRDIAEASVRALGAGADLLLYSAAATEYERIVEALSRGLEDGLLDLDRLEASAARLNRLRERFGEPPERPVRAALPPAALAFRVARFSMTLLEDPGGLLPLCPRTEPYPLLRVGTPLGCPVTEEEPVEELPLVRHLEPRGITFRQVELAELAEGGWVPPALVLRFSGGEVVDASERLRQAAPHVGQMIIVSMDVPVSDQWRVPGATHLLAYHWTPACQEALGDLLTGRSVPYGRNPLVHHGCR
jgi:beta-N-acetylhexosaminidase